MDEVNAEILKKWEGRFDYRFMNDLMVSTNLMKLYGKKCLCTQFSGRISIILASFHTLQNIFFN